jgi:hypothetical protein
MGADLGTVYQTKDFEQPYMEDYRITTDGRLIRKARWWCKEDGDEKDTDMNFHGILRLTHYDDMTRTLHVYGAKFTDGKLVEFQKTEET